MTFFKSFIGKSVSIIFHQAPIYVLFLNKYKLFRINLFQKAPFQPNSTFVTSLLIRDIHSHKLLLANTIPTNLHSHTSIPIFAARTRLERLETLKIFIEPQNTLRMLTQIYSTNNSNQPALLTKLLT